MTTTNRKESITILVKPGTRALLKEIHETTGLTKEDVFKLGLRYVFLKTAHDLKRAQEAEAESAPILTSSEEPNP